MIFFKRIFFMFARFPLLLEIPGDMCIVINSFRVDDIIKFEINPSFFIKPFYRKEKKVKTKSFIC